MVRSLHLVSSATTVAVLTGTLQAFAVDCFVDSVGGDDANTGFGEDQAVKTQAALAKLKNCTTAKYKRGSDFNEKVTVISSVKTYTNYGDCTAPLPKFHIARSPNNGGMFSAYNGGVTIDGLYLSGSMSDASMSNLMNGVCVMLGGGSKLLNSEITNCDIGVMLMGSGSLVQGNYVHDLFVSVDAAPGVDPNAVGGAEGIFINGSNNEVAYNSFIRCSNKADWTGGSCDGGATEVTAGAGATVSGVKVHHNFSYLSCGFFEVSSGFGSSKGTFADSAFYNNVSIDSGWLMLLQVNNTNLSNIRWENNTVVHRKATGINPGMLVTVFTGTSSGQTGGALSPDSVFLTNDYFVLHGFGAQDYVMALDSNLVIDNSPVIKTSTQDAGFVNIEGTRATDFDLVAGSPAIDTGSVTSRTLDFLNRSAPAGAAMDIGAFEYGVALGVGATAPIAAEVAVNGCVATGGTSATGGATSTAPNLTGGAPPSTGGAPPATGGSPPNTGGVQAATGGSPAATGGATTGAGEGLITGGAPQSMGGAELGAGGSAPGAGSSALGASTPVTSIDEGTCSCRITGGAHHRATAEALLGLLMIAFGLRRRRA
jgi:annexin A7/11